MKELGVTFVGLRAGLWRVIYKEWMRVRLLLALVAMGAAAFASAASPRTVTGVVMDRAGNALRGAAVEIENSKSLAVASYITHGDGRYYFHQLSPDVDYTLRAKYRNLWSKPRLLNKFSGGARVTIDLEIPTE